MIDTSAIYLDRYSAAQNTFFVANLFDPIMMNFYQTLGPAKKPKIIQHLCRDIFDQRTDGFLFLKPHTDFNFEWEFYNSDGSSAQMCGNAARCAALNFHVLAQAKGYSGGPHHLRFLTIAGDIGAEVLSRSAVRIEMTKIEKVEAVVVDGQRGVFINTGVPHFVVEIAPGFQVGKKFRFHPFFGAEGTNVTFIEKVGSRIKAVTYERGVENFTRACGTGAVAAAFVCSQAAGAGSSQNIEMPGGTLKVENLSMGSRPLLTGSVQHDYRMTNFLDFLEEAE